MTLELVSLIQQGMVPSKLPRLHHQILQLFCSGTFVFDGVVMAQRAYLGSGFYILFSDGFCGYVYG